MSMHVQGSADQHEVWVCFNVRAGHYSERWAIVSLPDLQARHDMLWTRDSAQHTERPNPASRPNREKAYQTEPNTKQET